MEDAIASLFLSGKDFLVMNLGCVKPKHFLSILTIIDQYILLKIVNLKLDKTTSS